MEERKYHEGTMRFRASWTLPDSGILEAFMKTNQEKRASSRGSCFFMRTGRYEGKQCDDYISRKLRTKIKSDQDGEWIIVEKWLLNR